MIFLRKTGYGFAVQADADEIEMAGGVLFVEVILDDGDVIAGLRDAVAQPQDLLGGKRPVLLREGGGAEAHRYEKYVERATGTFPAKIVHSVIMADGPVRERIVIVLYCRGRSPAHMPQW